MLWYARILNNLKLNNMKKNNRLLKEIEEAKNWIQWNKVFVSHLSKNEIINQNNNEIRKMNENELFLKPTWIINNLITQTSQYELIISNTKLLNQNI